MAGLPDIEFAAPVQGVRVDTQVAAAPYRAAAGFASEMAEGLSRIGQEMVKTEQRKADLALHEQLAGVEQALAAKPSLTAAEVRESLGEDLTPEVEKHLVNPDGTENNSIPTWRVAGAIYDAEARKAVSAAANSISTGIGWQSEFKARAAEAVLDRKVRMNEQQMRIQHDWQRREQANIIQRALTAQDWKLAEATVADSQVYTDPEKAKMLQEVRKSQQLDPVYNAIRSNNEGDLRAQRALLEDNKAFDAVEAEQRASLAHSIDSQLRAMEHEKKTAEQEARKAATWAAWDKLNQAMLEAKRVGRRPDSSWYRTILPQNAALIEPDDMKAMTEYLEREIKGESLKTDNRAWDLLNVAAVDDQENFKQGRININIREPGKKPQYVDLFYFRNRLSDDDFRTWSDRIASAALRGEGKGGKLPPSVVSENGVFKAEVAKYKPSLLGKKPSDADKAELGAIGVAVDTALAQAFHDNGDKPLEPAQSSLVIHNTVAGMASKRENEWYQWGTVYKFDPTDRPELAVTLRAQAQRRGEALGPEQLRSEMEDFDLYVPGMMDRWQRVKGSRVLSEVEAARVYEIIRTRGSDLRASLTNNPRVKFMAMSSTEQNAAVAKLALDVYLQRKAR